MSKKLGNFIGEILGGSLAVWFLFWLSSVTNSTIIGMIAVFSMLAFMYKTASTLFGGAGGKLGDTMHSLYLNIGKASSPDVSTASGREDSYKVIKNILQVALPPVKELRRYDDKEVVGIDFELYVDDDLYIIHAHVIKHNRVFVLSVWNKEEYDVQIILTEGFISEKHFHIGQAKERFNKWLQERIPYSMMPDDHSDDGEDVA